MIELESSERINISHDANIMNKVISDDERGEKVEKQDKIGSEACALEERILSKEAGQSVTNIEINEFHNDTSCEELKNQGSLSYVAAAHDGNNYIIIVEDDALRNSNALTLSKENGTDDIEKDSAHYNKVILISKAVSKDQAQIMEEENANENHSTAMSNEGESLPAKEDGMFVQRIGIDPKATTKWLKAFRPLPFYYTETGKPYLKCPACGAMSFTSTTFQKHLFTHMYKDSEVYSCSFCNYTNVEPGMIFAHLSKHQDQCEYCNENLMRKINFEKHRNACLPSFSVKRDQHGRFICSTCNLVFDLLSQMEKHWFRHSCKRDKTYQCKECWGLYSSKETLDNHKCLKCPVCGKSYDSLHKLKAHTMWTKHYLKCPICSYEFILTMDHEKHIAMHRQIYRRMIDQTHCLQAADGKSFQCDLCDKIFYSLPRLTEHLEEEHGYRSVKKEEEESEDSEEIEEEVNMEMKNETVLTELNLTKDKNIGHEVNASGCHESDEGTVKSLSEF
ncbi:zinc finger and BTB domain-containing protein 41-like [Prorops nasuta]|uniref:zinc finger and BTB domain-containing protein 41-like n=1 Tax=Prorops nasuta TaxID=863751 RepID=UPI0034CD1210